MDEEIIELTEAQERAVMDGLAHAVRCHEMGVESLPHSERDKALMAVSHALYLLVPQFAQEIH